MSEQRRTGALRKAGIHGEGHVGGAIISLMAIVKTPVGPAPKFGGNPSSRRRHIVEGA
jgi:hypothetical protein